MIRHALKLIWNRKRANALLLLEIFFSFLVVWSVGTLAIFSWDNYRRPLGFSYENVWNVEVDMKQDREVAAVPPELAAAFARVLREAQSLPGVEAAAGAHSVPFQPGSYVSGFSVGSRPLQTHFTETTEDLDRVLAIEMERGRWFEPGDAALSWQPVVIDEDLARAAFGTADPLGKRLGDPNPHAPSHEQRGEQRVVGVVRDFRRAGELSVPTHFLFGYQAAGDASAWPPRNILLRVRPGTPASFEEELVRRLQSVARDWSFEARPLRDMRADAFRRSLTPLILGGTVASFLMVMVALGLTGVVWQNLVQRTREIGLRRAAGASRASVHRQILAEQLLLTTFGILAAAVLVIQLPILDLTGFLSPQVFAGGLLLAAAVLYLLTAACALYPSWMASRIQPADALRYE